MDEQEKIEKLRQIRLIITEILMFISIGLLVGFLTLVVTGYSFNLKELGGEGEVIERTGLLQISSLPTGATITLDGESPLMLRTNGSRTLIAGEHEVRLTRDGYDSWEKKVKITEGLMYRLNYPRLFLMEREAEEVLELAGGAEFASVSPNKEKMLIVEAGKLYLVDLNSSKPVAKEILVKNTAGEAVKITKMSAKGWSGNSERVLAEINGKLAVVTAKVGGETAWIEEKIRGEGGIWSAEANREKIVIVDAEFETEAGERLLILFNNGELREMTLKDEKVGEALLTGVVRFDNDGERVFYLTESEARAYRVGEEKSFLVAEIEGVEAKLETMEYFEENYFAVAEGAKLSVFKAEGWISEDGSAEEIWRGEMGFEIAKLEKRGKGMVFAVADATGMRKGVFDIEALETAEFEMSGETGWVDEYLRYEVSEEGVLTVIDYDGLNRRKLVEEGVVQGHGVAISGNNKYLYYFSDGKLVREKIN